MLTKIRVIKDGVGKTREGHDRVIVCCYPDEPDVEEHGLFAYLDYWDFPKFENLPVHLLKNYEVEQAELKAWMESRNLELQDFDTFDLEQLLRHELRKRSEQ